MWWDTRPSYGYLSGMGAMSAGAKEDLGGLIASAIDGDEAAEDLFIPPREVRASGASTRREPAAVEELDPQVTAARANLNPDYTFESFVVSGGTDLAYERTPAKLRINLPAALRVAKGTVVINSTVRVSPAAVSHGNLVVTISENTAVSQPNALAEGTTTVVPQSDVNVSSTGDRRMFLFDPGVTLDALVRAVNQVGAGPSDLVAILEALKQAGALKADLVII